LKPRARISSPGLSPYGYYVFFDVHLLLGTEVMVRLIIYHFQLWNIKNNMHFCKGVSVQSPMMPARMKPVIP